MAASARTQHDLEDETAIAEEERLMDTLESAISLIHLPIMVLASGRTSLADKSKVFMQAMFLVFFETPEDYSYALQVFMQHAADFGVEYSLPLVNPVPIRSLLPWVVLQTDTKEPDKHLPQVCGEDDWEVPPEEEEEWEGAPADNEFVVGLGESVATAGCLHIFHNAGNRLVDACPILAEEVDAMGSVVNY